MYVNKLHLMVFVFLATLWLGSIDAVADTIYGLNGNVKFPPVYSLNSWAGGPNPQAVLADDFRLGSDSVLNSINLWTYDTSDGSTALLKDIQYAIYTGPSPTGAAVVSGLGAITAQGQTGITGLVPGMGKGLFQVLTVSFDVNATFLHADTQYWLVLTGDTNPFGVSNSARWAEADTAPLGGATQLQNGNAWDTVGGDRAFVLNGHAVAVPEPSSFAMLVLGFVSVMVEWLRRHRETENRLKSAIPRDNWCQSVRSAKEN